MNALLYRFSELVIFSGRPHWPRTTKGREGRSASLILSFASGKSSEFQVVSQFENAAHEQVWVKVDAPVDEGVAEIVSLLGFSARHNSKRTPNGACAGMVTARKRLDRSCLSHLL